MDTGSVDCLVPRNALEAIGLKPKSQRSYELADGSEVKMNITTAEIEFMGDIAGVTIDEFTDQCRETPDSMQLLRRFVHLICD